VELPVVSNNENADLCGPCGGQCCKSYPGAYHPAQFGPNLEGVEQLLRAGKAAIDWWEGELRDYEGTSYYLRAAIAGVNSVFHPAFGGSCAMLTETGCSLSWDVRPLDCRMLKPMPGTSKGHVACVTEGIDGYGNSKEYFAHLWQPFARRLEEIGQLVDQDK
jgi:hypothetical protein